MLPIDDCYLDHIAIAVESIVESKKIYEQIGLKFSSEEEIVDEQKVKTAFAPIDKNAHLELLESTDPEGPIAKYIAKKGAGIHHLCFKVKDLDKKIMELTSHGFKLIYDQPVKGAGGNKVNFIHPKSTGGVLIELSESL